jgi:hypothetical protein
MFVEPSEPAAAGARGNKVRGTLALTRPERSGDPSESVSTNIRIWAPSFIKYIKGEIKTYLALSIL